jgi:predicted GNAT family acetyltransferase
MAVTIMKCELVGAPDLFGGDSACYELSPAEEAEVLGFLAERAIHTVFMATLIRDNGLVSPRNRGTFYAFRDRFGKLVGVALIGHATIIEARTDFAVAAFAQLAAHTEHAYLIRGERKIVEQFWREYAAPEQQPRLICRELMFEKIDAAIDFEPVEGLRVATLDDIEHVLNVNALLAFEEGGVSPIQRDPAGFRARTARRIEQGRVWLWMQDGKPLFKADLLGDTPEMIYLEGIHVHPDQRSKGYGRRCLAQLSSQLMRRSNSICLTVNQRKADAVAFYVKAGFDFHSEYETIYLR